MAYLSETTGEIEIAANSLEVLKELKKCFNTTRTWWHNISCIDLDDKKVVKYYGAMQYGYLQYHIIYEFKGSGDGSFPITLGVFQDWLEKKIIINKLFQDSDFIIAFNYIDQNSKQNFINDQYSVLRHVSGKTAIESQNIYKAAYEYSLVNKTKCTRIPLNKIISNDFEYKDSSYIVSTLYKERKDIEEYTGKLLEVYLYENGLGDYAELYNKYITL